LKNHEERVEGVLFRTLRPCKNLESGAGLTGGAMGLSWPMLWGTGEMKGLDRDRAILGFESPIE